jgi:hypothetical protein
MRNLLSLVKSWIKYSKDSKKYSTRFWAVDKVCDYVQHEPEIAFKIILLLIQEANEDRILALIAAGPLEDFTRLYYKEYMDTIETQLRQNPSFRKCMTGVWFGSNFPKSVLKTILKYTKTVQDPL